MGNKTKRAQIHARLLKYLKRVGQNQKIISWRKKVSPLVLFLSEVNQMTVIGGAKEALLMSKRTRMKTERNLKANLTKPSENNLFSEFVEN